MKQWYYNVGGEQQGPSSDQELIRLLGSHRLAPDTLVWSEGMPEWVPANGLPELKEIQEPAQSPYAPPTSDPIAGVDWSGYVATGSQNRPWIRYWARTADIYFICFVIGWIAGIAAPQILEIPDTLFGILILPVFFVVEPAMFAMWGTTPFKALLKIRVRNHDGSKLTYLQALRRGLKIWIRGLGLGVPLITLITHISSYNHLKINGITSWDAEGPFEVSHREIGWIPVLVLVVFFAGLVSLIVLWNETV